MNGDGFCKAGKLAFHILTKNAFNIIAIKAISGNVFNLLMLFVTVFPIALLIVLTVRLFLKPRNELPHFYFQLNHWQQSFITYILLMTLSGLLANTILSSFQVSN